MVVVLIYNRYNEEVPEDLGVRIPLPGPHGEVSLTDKYPLSRVVRGLHPQYEKQVFRCCDVWTSSPVNCV